mmetsp:Transcript_2841/g.6630  ORF Transcript_2841/g.6630 Transcript_2841/m.6630 type:complete len:261 (-) Transcript_2841:262-1044(-)
MVPLWLILAYLIAFVGTLLSTYIVALYTSDIDVIPLLCEAGGEQPAYTIFSFGMTVASLLYMAIVWMLYASLVPDASGGTRSILNLTALILGFASGVGLVFMSCLSIRGRFARRHNDAVAVYLVGSLGHAALIAALSCIISASLLVRQWRCIVTIGAGLCVVGMLIARRLYVRALRRQQPIYKNLFNGRPVSRVITGDSDLMGELEYGQAHLDARPSESVNLEDPLDDEQASTNIKRVWAGIQYIAVGCLLLFQLSLTFH